MQISAPEIVARVCDSIATAIETLTDAAGRLLPHAEKLKLEALAGTLKQAARGLRLGQLDMTSARSMVKTSLSFALGEMGGAALSVLFAAFGTYASTIAPTPFTRLAAIIGFGAIGAFSANYFDNSGVADNAAALLTNGLFDGVEAFTNAINSFLDQINQAFESMIGYPNVPRDLSMNLSGQPGDSGSYEVTIYNAGNPWQLTADANNSVMLPEIFNSNGDPKSPWNDDQPI